MSRRLEVHDPLFILFPYPVVYPNSAAHSTLILDSGGMEFEEGVH
jgi:hypothetical protein